MTLFWFLFWGCTRPKPARTHGPPNVVMVMGCTLRTDQLTPYGGPENTTPFLASLARQGVRFETTVAAAPWTKPASTAILTGREPTEVGIIELAASRNHKLLPAEVVTLGERFKQAGYQTVGVVGNPNLDARFGFAQGFDHYIDTTTLQGEWTSKKINGKALVEKALAVVDPSRPFFLRMMLLDAHQPNKPDPLSRRRFVEEGVSDAVVDYRTDVRSFDAALKKLIAGLKDQGVWEQTVFVLVGDHGEGLRMPEHHGNAHGFYLYPSVTHVPWIMHGPQVGTGVISGLTEQKDVVPTLIGLFDLDPAPDLKGRDLSNLVGLGSGVVQRDQAMVGTWFRMADRAAFYERDRFCQQDFAKTLSRQLEESYKDRGFRQKPHFPDGCFDLQADPELSAPLDDPAAMAALRTWRDARVAEQKAFADEAPAIDEGTKQRLEALGYVE